jgi:hypothetical protein
MNVGICDYTTIPFVANLAFLQKKKKTLVYNIEDLLLDVSFEFLLANGSPSLWLNCVDWIGEAQN